MIREVKERGGREKEKARRRRSKKELEDRRS